MNDGTGICLINDSFPPLIDGVANAVVNYGTIIEEQYGHVIVATPDHPDAAKVDEDFPFPVYRTPSIDMRKQTGYMAGIPFSPELELRLREEKVELIHTHCPIVSAMLAREMRTKLNVPLVLTYHTKYDIDIANVIRSKILQESSIKALVDNVSACDEVWVVSEGAGENIRSLGYEGDYIVMPNGVDLPKGRVSDEDVKRVTGGYDLPRNVPVYLFVGRLMWYKGLHIILDALAVLKNKQDFRMVFVGAGGDEAEVKEEVRKKGLEDKVIFVGPVYNRDDIRAWYTRADLFLFPSTFDTNGLVVREAAACSLASVVIKNSCASEGTVSGRNIFQIEEDFMSLLALLSELGDNFERMHTVGDTAVRELYVSWEEAVGRAYDRYQVVIDRFKSGMYPSHDRLSDGFWQVNGALMSGFADSLKRQEEAQRRMLEAQVRIAQKQDADRTKVGIHIEQLAEKTETLRDKAVEKIEDLIKENRDELKASHENFRKMLEHGDRYL